MRSTPVLHDELKNRILGFLRLGSFVLPFFLFYETYVFIAQLDLKSCFCCVSSLSLKGGTSPLFLKPELVKSTLEAQAFHYCNIESTGVSLPRALIEIRLIEPQAYRLFTAS